MFSDPTPINGASGLPNTVSTIRTSSLVTDSGSNCDSAYMFSLRTMSTLQNNSRNSFRDGEWLSESQLHILSTRGIYFTCTNGLNRACFFTGRKVAAMVFKLPLCLCRGTCIRCIVVVSAALVDVIITFVRLLSDLDESASLGMGTPSNNPSTRSFRDVGSSTKVAQVSTNAPELHSYTALECASVTCGAPGRWITQSRGDSCAVWINNPEMTFVDTMCFVISGSYVSRQTRSQISRSLHAPSRFKKAIQSMNNSSSPGGSAHFIPLRSNSRRT
ncbi:LORF3 [Gallid alphaherpesvirus 3]|uniref:LORF3 protein n=2 Tax=Gallid alphaherpesvirus 3 TaxID=35250 RepID=Q782S4_9ALPH|nr:ORF273 protein [Gallid alphaherpesvirus 3]AEI00224.1 ORF273 protein [Gallid alphaherpesvirus 3]QEY02265.1 ORF273 protein [Gallid alphaherpesvirus 3]BAA82916.1 MDV2 ORF273 protein [Marek's disease virus serotype 2 MDV2]BAB16530.1 LORF3 [Gallid alphaherpesvirus 3]